MAEEQPKQVSRPVQKKRFTAAEEGVIKATFKDNLDLCIALRKHFLQIPLDVIDQRLIKDVRENKVLTGIVRKAWLPTLDGRAPVHQLVDLFMTAEIKDKPTEMAYVAIMAKEKTIKYFDQRCKALETGKDSKGDMQFVDFVNFEKRNPEEVHINMFARNYILAHGEQQIQMFQVLSVQELTPEEKAANAKKNSQK